MSPWRLELLRLWRTRRLIALASVFGLIGLGIPVLDHYLPSILKHAGTGGVRITVPPPTPAQTLKDVGSNVAQLGTLVLVVVAAASLAIDARPPLSIFYRTRARGAAALIVPRYVTVTAAGIATMAVGVLAAWYETAILIGQPRAHALIAGFGLEAVWLCFAVGVVAGCASLTRSVLAITGTSLATLLSMALLANIPTLASWAPTALASGMGDLARLHDPSAPWHALLITVPATAVLLAASTARIARQYYV